MSFILNFLLESAVGFIGSIFSFFINVITGVFALDGAQTLNLFYATFPGTEDIIEWSKWCGLLIIVIVFFVQLIKIMAGPVTKAERPLSLVVRTVVFGAAISLSKPLCEFIFTIATGPFKAMRIQTKISLFESIGKTVSGLGKNVGEDIAKNVDATSDFVAGCIAPFITIFLIISLFGAFLKLLLEVVERYLILGVLTVFSPLAIATGCSAATSNIFASWVRAMISQCLLMIFSTFFLSVLYNGMIQMLFDAQQQFLSSFDIFGSIKDFVTHEEINDSTMLCVRVMMLVAWCRLGTTMDRHLQTLGLTTLQAGDGLAMDLRNAGSMAKGLAKGAGGFAGGLAGGLAALKSAGGGGNNNTTNNNSNQTSAGGQKGSKAPGVGSSNISSSPAGKGTSAGSLSNNCQPINNALKDAGISAGNGTTDENGVTTFPLTGPNGEDLGDISLSKDVPEDAADGNFVAVDDGAGNILYAQASDEGVQDVLNNSDDDSISVGVVNENNANNNPIDDSDKEAKDAIDGAETFDMVPMDEDGNAVDADVPDSISEDQVSFDDDGTPYFDADGQNVPLVDNGDGTYTPANYGVAQNQDGSGEYAMSTSGELVQIPNLNNIPASQVKTDANGNSYCSINGQNIPVQKNSNGTYSMATSIPASQVKTNGSGNSYCNVNGQNMPVKKNGDGTYSMATSIPSSQIKTGANGSSLCNVGGQDVAVKNNGNGTYGLAASIPASQVKTDANGNSYCSVGGQNIPVTKNSDGSYSPASSMSSSQVKTDTSGNSFCSVGGQDIPVTKNSDSSYTPETSIPASQVKTDSNGATFCNVGGQDISVTRNSDGSYSSGSSIPASQVKTDNSGVASYSIGGQDISVNKNNDGTYSPSASSVLGTSTDNLIKSADHCQPGDMVYGTDPRGGACIARVSSSNFDNVSARGLDGKQHDITGLVNENGAISSQNMVATGFKGAGNFSRDTNSGDISFSDRSGNKFTVPSNNVSVDSSGRIAVKSNKDGSFVAKDSSGASRIFEPTNTAIRSKDGAYCQVNRDSNGYKPNGLRYDNLKQNVVVQAQNVKTIDSRQSYDKTNNLSKKQGISIKLSRASKNSKKSDNIIGTVSGADYNKMKKIR